ncbi:MAG: S1 family peptidase [Pseudobdellovibrionaceae bacterium]
MRYIPQFTFTYIRFITAIVVIVPSMWTPSGFSAEGFYTSADPMPPAVSKAWSSVFFVLINEPTIYRMGTAFLVRKIVDSKVTDLYFLTNLHVIKQACPTSGLCQNASLAQDAHLIYQSDGLHLQSLDGVVLDQMSVVKVSVNPDLALLHVRASNNNNVQLPNSLPISPSCEMAVSGPLYTIGFSDPFDRRNSTIPIKNRDSIFKRWSHGIFTGYTKSDDNNNANTNLWSGTSVDALEGGSGGPLLDQSGKVVGVMKNSASTEANNYHYGGNEDPKGLDWQSNAVRCEYLEKFITDGIPNVK